MLQTNNLLKSVGKGLRPNDVFNTTIYNGNSGTQTINAGFDMLGKGGLVWIKGRSVSSNNSFVDTTRSRASVLFSNTTDIEQSVASGFDLTAFTSTGFTLGPSQTYSSNTAGEAQVSWSFARQTGFFDIVTYTGNGVAGRQIPHSLGVVPGMVIVKTRSTTQNWFVWHRSLVAGTLLGLNTTQAAVNDASISNVTATSFTVDSFLNVSGVTYVAYLFAQNPQLIDCGSYIGNGSTTGPIVTCGSGWRPQWLMVKNSSGIGNWSIVDTARGIATGVDSILNANTSTAELNGTDLLNLTSTGFQIKESADAYNAPGQTYIYFAIREAY